MTNDDYEREFERQRRKYEYDMEQEALYELVRLARERVVEAAKEVERARSTRCECCDGGYDDEACTCSDYMVAVDELLAAVRALRELEAAK